MKFLINKKTDIDLTIASAIEKGAKVTYADLIKLVCNTMIQGGYNTSDIKARLTIMGAIDNIEPEQEIHLENADAAYLQNAVKNQKWALIHKDIIAFVDDVEKMAEKK